MVTITTSVPAERHPAIARAMHQQTAEVAALTPRSTQRLLRLLRSGDIAMAFDGEELIGWVIAEPYSPLVQELGMAYVAPHYRNQGILARLVGRLAGKRPVSVAVTYEAGLREFLVSRLGFEPSSLAQVTRLTNGRFVTSRVKSIQAVKAVLTHTSQAKPMYVMRNRHEER